MRIIISENSEQQIIYLKEVDGDRMFPIVIGIFEATSIDRRVRDQPTPRPLTHDLLASAIELLGGEIQDIYISELRDHTYFAKLRIRHEGEIVEVDSRPSDAIAVAVTVDVPIYVAEDIIEEVGQIDAAGHRSRGRHRLRRESFGGVPEWSIGTVLKTVEGSHLPWVRIPPPPLARSNGDPTQARAQRPAWRNGRR